MTPAKDLNDEMNRHGRALAQMIEAEYGHSMDFSEPTIGIVESILNGVSEDSEIAESEYHTWCILLGAYIGEVARKAYDNAAWLPAPPDSPTGAPYVRVDPADVDIFPITWCFKRLYNGPEDDVSRKYLGFCDAVRQQRGE